MKKEITLRVHEPLNSIHISVDIATIGWKTMHYKIYDKGVAYPDIIPDSSNLYIVRITYKDSLTSSQVYVHHNKTIGSNFNFNLIKRKN